MFRRHFFHCLIAISFVLGTACGEDPENNSSNIFIPDSGPTQDADVDAGMSDADSSDMGDGGGMDAEMDAGDGGDADMSDSCEDIVCSIDQDCVAGACVDRVACDAAADAGTLVAGDTTEVSGSFIEDGSSELMGTCGEVDQLEQLVRFEITERSRVEWRVSWDGQFDGLVALRDGCDTDATETQCSDSENGSVILDAGTYYLLLEVRFGNPGTWNAELTATPSSGCTPGTATCDMDDRLVCTATAQERVESCPVGCTDGSCAGDSCSNPIDVVGGGGVYTGTGGALTSTLDFDGNTACAQVPGNSTSSPGYELVLRIPNVFAGQVISIDALTNDSNINDIYIQRTCGDQSMCVASYQGTQNPDFVALENGDYFVIIEKRQVSNAPFEYSVTVQ